MAKRLAFDHGTALFSTYLEILHSPDGWRPLRVLAADGALATGAMQSSCSRIVIAQDRLWICYSLIHWRSSECRTVPSCRRLDFGMPERIRPHTFMQTTGRHVQELSIAAATLLQ